MGLAVVGDRHGAAGGVELLGGVDPERGVDRGVEVGDRDGPVDDRPGQVVGGADDPAGAEAAAGQQGAEGGGLVAPAAAGVELGGAAELGGDDDQRRVEPADPLQVVEQGGEGAVELGDQLVLLELALVVGVPAGAVEEVEVVRDLDEPDARLDQPAGQQAALAELAAVRLRDATTARGRAGRPRGTPAPRAGRPRGRRPRSRRPRGRRGAPPGSRPGTLRAAPRGGRARAGRRRPAGSGRSGRPRCRSGRRSRTSSRGSPAPGVTFG